MNNTQIRLRILKINSLILINRSKMIPHYIKYYYKLAKIHIKYLPSTLRLARTNIRIAWVTFKIAIIKQIFGS